MTEERDIVERLRPRLTAEAREFINYWMDSDEAMSDGQEAIILGVVMGVYDATPEAAAEIVRLRAELAAARDKALEEAALEWLKPPISGTRNFAEILRAMKGTPNAEGQ